MPANIEVEVRSFVTDSEYARLAEFFAVNARALGADEQVTYYFDASCRHAEHGEPRDVRIQRNARYAKLWLKSGKIHDEQRQEIEVRFARDDFEKMEDLFAAMGYGVKIKWFRHRLSFEWQDVSVALDDTRGYGKILELELLVSENEKDAALETLRRKMADLDIGITPRAEFDRRYAEYVQRWRELTEVTD